MRTRAIPYEVMLVPITVLGNLNSNKRREDKLIEKLDGIKTAFDTISKNPSRYAVMVVSSRIADPPTLDIIREVKKANHGLNVLIALDSKDDNDGGTAKNLPFIDQVVHTPIESIDLAQILSLVGNQGEKEALLLEMMSLGADANKFRQCSIVQLRDLVKGLRHLILKARSPDTPTLSEADRLILKELILSKGKISSLTLSKKLSIPLTTMQRKRKKLENEFLTTSYSLKYERFGLRKAVLLINTVKGNNDEVGKKLLLFDEVLSVHKSIGNNNIDLHAEILIKNNTKLLSLMESIKAMDGVRDVAWSETLKEIGTNTNAIIRIFDSD
ncbi:MAG TPA: hypothetical protein VF172_01335 [Nitrososphaera sp.]